MENYQFRSYQCIECNRRVERLKTKTEWQSFKSKYKPYCPPCWNRMEKSSKQDKEEELYQGSKRH
jgi:hypothetical protein